MRAISLWQPWASAVAIGAKGVETRHWSTDYRGPLAIHASKRRVQWELDEMTSDASWCAALAPLGKWWVKPETIAGLDCRMPFGAVVAVVDLVDVKPSEDFGLEIDELRTREGHAGAWSERMMGNYGPGRFGWILGNVRRLREPLPWKGAQSFFDVPSHLIEVNL